MIQIVAVMGFAVALFAAPAAIADVYDLGSDNDNDFGTDNELVHGTRQRHDLGALPGPVADEDWYKVAVRPGSSFEVLIDGTNGDIGLTVDVDRIDSDDTTVLQSSVAVGIGYSRSLRWLSGGADPDESIRVISGGCATTCGPEDVYDIRFYDTTISVPRYNNASGQTTVLIIQNPASYTASGVVTLRNAAGATVATFGFGLVAGATRVQSLSTVNGGIANNTSGSVTIAHDARYGDLNVKTVALEPATGFSFDSPGLHKPQ